MVEGKTSALEAMQRGFFFALGAMLLKLLVEAATDDE